MNNHIQIESFTKDLENCLSSTHEELNNQRIKVNESKNKVKLLTQKMHKFIADEKPLTKEISKYQKQIIQNEINNKKLKLNSKQNEIKINKYKIIIEKSIIDSKENNQILIKENNLLQQFHHRTEKSKEQINKLNKNFKYSEDNYQYLKEIFYFKENKNKQLKQEYANLIFVVKLLGQRQVILNNQFKPLYEKLKSLTKQHFEKGRCWNSAFKLCLFLVKMIEQSKSDLDILRKYYLHLQSYNYQLHQSFSFISQSISNKFELKMKTNSNHIHYWYTLMINSPEKFNNLLKLISIKKKLVKKSNELLFLRKIFYEKNTLYHYLNQIYQRRQKLIEKMNINDQLIKQKQLRCVSNKRQND